MKLQSSGRWILDVNPEANIPRTDAPTILEDIDQAVDWIRREKPILWIGSIFSVPEPSNCPSGRDLNRWLLDMVVPHFIPEKQREQRIETLLPLWPLESLLDEFELARIDMADSLLDSFSRVNDSQAFNALHDAVVSYYQHGFAKQPLCVTTNWDTFLEQAFRQKGYKVVVGSVGKIPDEDFGRSDDPNTMFVYHPHGSFESKDVVCSAKQEQAQLPFSSEEWIFHPALFLGYSGYEPSLYRKLENPAQHQLWCVLDKNDLKIPSKRRLLCRPNTYVFVGDMRDLLQRLGVLSDKVELQSKSVQNTTIPQSLLNIVSSSINATFDVDFCINALTESLQSFLGEPEATIRYTIFMRALVHHMRNRISNFRILPALLTSALFRDSEQTWVSVLAYLLRMNEDLDPHIIKKILEFADRAKQASEDTGVAATLDGSTTGERFSLDDARVYKLGVLSRTKIYKSYVGQGKKIDDRKSYYNASVMSPNIGGELFEILAFERLRNQNLQIAQNLFDYAATSFYLCGLSRAGELNEWASKNAEKMMNPLKRNTLFFPVKF